MLETLKKQWFVVLIAIIFICFTVFIIYDTNKGKLPGKTDNGKDVVATFNGKNITADDVYNELYESGNGNSILNIRLQAAIIDENVKTTKEIKETAKKEKELITQQIESQASQSGMSVEDGIKDTLARVGMQEDEFDYFCLIQAKIKKIQDDSFEPICKDNQGRTVSHILVRMKDANNPTKEEMKVVKQIEKDLKTMSFEEVAKKHADTGDSSAPNGGYLGYMDKNTGFVNSFKTNALKLKKGEVSDWVKEKNEDYSGWHLIRVNETDAKKIKKDDKAQQSINQQIAENYPNVIQDFVVDAAKNLKFEYANDDIKKDVESFLKLK